MLRSYRGWTSIKNDHKGWHVESVPIKTIGGHHGIATKGDRRMETKRFIGVGAMQLAYDCIIAKVDKAEEESTCQNLFNR